MKNTYRHFELTRSVLRYFDGCKVKGSIMLLDATLTDLSEGDGGGTPKSSSNKEASLEFSLTSRSGYLLKCRTITKVAKDEWLEAISGAISLAASPSLSIEAVRASMRLQRSSSVEQQRVSEAVPWTPANNNTTNVNSDTASASDANTSTALPSVSESVSTVKSSSKLLIWLVSLLVLIVAYFWAKIRGLVP